MRNTLTLAVFGALLLALASLPGCAWNPFGPMPGQTSFRMGPDGAISYQSSRDIGHASGEFTFPNGARGKFRVADIKGADVAAGAVAQQAQLNGAIVAALASKFPDLAKLLLALAAAPAAAIVPAAGP